MNKYLIIGLVVLCIALTAVTSMYKNMKQDRDRQNSNMENITKENKNLVLKLSDYNALNTEFKNKLDSVLKANNIKPKQLVSATITNTAYKDTSKVSANTGTPVIQPQAGVIKPLKPVYNISVNYSTPCWGMKGEIITTDPTAKFNILEKSANNSSQLIVTKAKYFIFIRLKKAKYHQFSDCGTSTFTDIKFVK